MEDYTPLKQTNSIIDLPAGPVGRCPKVAEKEQLVSPELHHADYQGGKVQDRHGRGITHDNQCHTYKHRISVLDHEARPLIQVLVVFLP